MHEYIINFRVTSLCHLNNNSQMNISWCRWSPAPGSSQFIDIMHISKTHWSLNKGLPFRRYFIQIWIYKEFQKFCVVDYDIGFHRWSKTILRDLIVCRQLDYCIHVTFLFTEIASALYQAKIQRIMKMCKKSNMLFEQPSSGNPVSHI